RNKENRKPSDELKDGDCAGSLQGEHTNDEISNDVYNCSSDNFIERVLDKAAEPAPEQPFELRNNKKWNKHRPNKHAHGRCNESVGDHDDGYGLRSCEESDDDGIDNDAEEVGHAGRIQAGLKIANSVDDRLQLALVDSVGEELRFIRNQIMKAASDPGDGT